MQNTGFQKHLKGTEAGLMLLLCNRTPGKSGRHRSSESDIKRMGYSGSLSTLPPLSSSRIYEVFIKYLEGL